MDSTDPVMQVQLHYIWREQHTLLEAALRVLDDRTDGLDERQAWRVKRAIANLQDVANQLYRQINGEPEGG